MAVARYVFPDLATFTNAVDTIQNKPLSESDVNGLWNSAILPVYFPYHSPVQHALKPEFIHGKDRYDILVTKQTLHHLPQHHDVTEWTWILIYEGKGPKAVSWDVLRAQVTEYFRNSGLPKFYAIGAIGRFCKIWEWNQSAHHNEEFQLTVDNRGNVVSRRGQFDPFDVATHSINVEKCIEYVKAHVA